MDEDLVVALEIVGFARAHMQIMKISQAVAGIGRPLASTNQYVAQTARHLQGAIGPAQRLANAFRQMQAAKMSGDPSRMFDAQFNLQKSQGAYSRAQQSMSGGGIGQLIRSAISSTRIGVGSGGLSIMPLVGRMWQLLGRAGPWGAAIVAAGTAVMGFTEMVQNAAKAAGSFARSALTSGGTPTETAALNGLGGAIGGVDMSRMAREFREAIAYDPYAMNYASQAGIKGVGMPSVFGDQDTATNLIQWAKHLRDIDKTMGRPEAIRQARATHTEGMLPMLNLSDSMMKNLAKDAKSHGAIFDSAAMSKSADFMASLSRVGDAFTNLLMSISKPVLDKITSFFNGLADTLNNAATWINGHQDLIKLIADFFSAIFHAATFNFKAAFDDVKNMGVDINKLMNPTKPDGGEDKLKKALDDNTDATYAQMNGMRQIFGGGERARGAVPARLKGMAFSEGMRNNSIQLGAFAL